MADSNEPIKPICICSDPNDWAEEVGNERYILGLLLSVINVSIQTIDIVNKLPEVEFQTSFSIMLVKIIGSKMYSSTLMPKNIF